MAVAAWEAYKEIEAAFHAGKELYEGGKEISNAIGGRKRTKSGTLRPTRNINHSDHGKAAIVTPPTSSQSNPPASTEMHRRISTGNQAVNNGDEVPVVPPPKKVSKIHPDYFTVNLPYIAQIVDLTAVQIPFVNATQIARIRLNSIYDPIVGALLNNQPVGRDTWASHFKYYRVLRANVKLTWVSNYPTRDKVTIAAHPISHSFAVGFEVADQDASISNNCHMFLTTKHAKRDIMPPAKTIHNTYWNGTVAVKDSNVSENRVLHQYYTYNPTSWDHHVSQVGAEERWTPIGANPAVDHDLVLRCFHMDATQNPLQDDLMNVMIQINYEVQFREVMDSIIKEFPTSTASYPDANSNADD
jgi:hypothetical protein